MGRLDRYVLRIFLLYWMVLGAALLGFFTVLDVIGHADELAESRRVFGPILHEAALYYAFNIVFLAVQFAPYLTLLSGLATVLSLSRRRELTPMLVAGRSTLRITMPVFLGAALLAVLMVAAREEVVPRIVLQREAIGRKIFSQRPWQLRDVWARSSDDVRMRAGEFLPRGAGPFGDGAPEILDFEVYRTTAQGEDQLLRADRASWTGAGWRLENGRMVMAAGAETAQELFHHRDLDPRGLVLSHLGLVGPLDLAAGDLRDLLARDPDNRQAATLLWAWRATPLSHWILLLLGLPFALRLDRRSRLEGLAKGMLLCLLFFVAEFVLRDLGARGVVNPFLGGFGPTLLFGSLSIWALDRLPT